jgi:hypothetical protein
MPEDVQILLKPSHIEHTDVETKERLIQSGQKHYSEMLSPEKVPDERYMRLYRDALSRNASLLAVHVEYLARSIAARPQTSHECVVISLARAGTPIGVLLKRALQRIGIAAHHYSISIIRGRGIDLNALGFIAKRHGVETSIFLDGWTGKGAIKGQLERSLAGNKHMFSPFLAVVADPAGCADLAATTNDYLIPSGILGAIVSGLISRSVLSSELVGPADFHACLYQHEQAPYDVSRDFIDAIESAPKWVGAEPFWSTELAARARASRTALIEGIMNEKNVSDVNRIKPGIAEATRAILRRVPHMVLVRDLGDPEIEHIVHLSAKNSVPVTQTQLENYRAVTIIKKLKGEQE